MTRWRIAALTALAILLTGIGLWQVRDRILMASMSRIYDRAFSGDPLAALPDGLHVGLCGSGSPLPDPTRQGPCVAVVAGNRLFVVDSGGGGTRRLSLMNLPPAEVSAVFLTHFHSDHIDGLGELMLQRWAGGAWSTPLPVYGPTGVDQIVHGYEAAYALDRGYRIAHHGPAVVPPTGFGGDPRPFTVDKNKPDVLLIDEPNLRVIAFPVDHHPVEPAVGYLFIYKGRRLVVSGDTAPSPRLEAAARDADVLVHEALAPNLLAIQRDAALRAGRTNIAHILHDILSYHTTPEQAAAIAARAHVSFLLLNHIIPPLPTPLLDDVFLGRSHEIYRGPIRVGEDGDFVSMPTGGHQITRTNRLKFFQ